MMDNIDPKLFIYGGFVLAIGGFFLIHSYIPIYGPLENAMTGNIQIGEFYLPYRYVLACAALLIGYGAYKLKAARPSSR